MFLDGYVLGSYLAGLFCLNREYFKNAYSKKIKLDAELIKQNGFVFVKVPANIRELIEAGYISCKIESDDKQIYKHRYELSKTTTIGFWK